MLISYKRGQTGIVLRVKILASNVSTGAGLTGLTSASSGLVISTIADNEATPTVYTVAGSTIESITTLGTYAAPTATKCRFKEVSANHPGIYELQIADARFAVASAKSLLISISGATNAAETDVCIPLQDLDPYDAVRAGLTALPNFGAGGNQGLPVLSASGNLNYILTTVTNLTNFPTAGDFTAAMKTSLNAATPAVTVSDKTGFKLASDGLAAVTTWTVAITGNVTGNLSGSVGSVTGLTASNLDATISSRASSSEVTAIQNNTRTVIVVPEVIERPDAGSDTYKVHLYLYDEVGNMEAPDSTPTVTLVNSAGTDRSARLSAATVVGTGHYSWVYTNTSTDTLEQLLWEFSVVEGGATRLFGRQSLLVDTTAVDFTAADRTNLGLIKTKTDFLPSAVAGAAGGVFIAGANAPTTVNITGTITTVTNLTNAPTAGDFTAAMKTSLNAATPAVTISDKTGFKLASDGIDAIAIESGLNARQAISIMSSSAAGVLAGAATATITIKAANAPATTRIVATVDVDGNRSAVALTPPA